MKEKSFNNPQQSSLREYNVFVAVAITETRLRSLTNLKECVMYIVVG